ncbi:MAG TPA: hypothetical protein VFF14_07555 [Candidatus Deferrimicrobium sp.]|nr:hypothetical protein [Candidatus Deferrimicrobium sp.]
MGNAIVSILSILIGIIPGFFIVFNSVFSDSNGSIGERAFTFFLVLLSYGLLGFLFSLFAKIKPTILCMCLSAPALIILVLYSFKEPGVIGLSLVYAALVLVSSWLGAYLGDTLRKSKMK